MRDEDKTKQQLMGELVDLRRRVTELEVAHTQRLSPQQASQRADEGLRRSEYLLREVGAMAHVGGWELDPASGSRYWSDEVCHIHEVPVDGVPVTAEQAIAFYAPEARPVIAAAMQKAMDTGEPYDLELPLITAKGNQRWVRTIGRAEKREGQPVRLLGTFQDITDHKVAEARLQAAAQEWRDTFDAIGDAVYLVDADRRIRRCNRAMADLLGKPFDQIIGQTCCRLVHGAREPIEGCPVLRMQQTLRPEQATLQVGERWLEVTTDPLLDGDGALVGSVHVLSDVTEHMRTDEALRESQERFRTLFEFAPDAYYLSDLKAVFVDGNRAAEKITGYQRDELIGKSFLKLKLLTAAQIPTVAALLARNVLGHPTGPDELTLIRKDGSRVPVEISTVPVEIGGRNLVLGIARDITQRKRAEAAMSASEQRYRDLFENARDVNVTFDLKGNITSVNKAAVQYGFTEYEICGQNMRQFVSRRYWPRLLRDMAALGRGNPTQGQIEITTAKGERLLEYSSNPIREANKVIGVQSILRDVTERRRAEEEIRSLARFARENPYPMLRVAADGTVLDANDASAPLLDLWGSQIADTLPDVWRQPIAEALASGGPTTTEIALGQQTFSLAFAPVPEGAYVNIYALDISERVELEGNLRQAAKMEAVGRLAGGVAHDFNNLLQVINGTSEIILTLRQPNEPLRQDVEGILRAGQRAAHLTRHLLAFSRRQAMQIRVFDLNEVLSGMHSLLHRIIGEDVHLETTFATDLDPIRADPAGIQQVVLNLAANARDAMPTGGTLTIETTNVHLRPRRLPEYLQARPGPYVLLAISDTGEGIDAEVKKHLFEPFFTTKEVGQGTGLGLSIVYGTIQEFGGGIDVISEPGQGTTFRIYLPRVEGAETVPTDLVISRALPRGTETILVVEDQDIVRRLAVRLLGELGYTAIEASSAREALHLCASQAQPVDLVLADVVMPGMSGPQLVDRLRALGHDFAVLYISGYADDTIKARTHLEEPFALIRKPVSIEELAQRIRQALDKA